MEDGPYYSENLYYVWGFNGVLLVDCVSHTEAGEVYAAWHECDLTMVELVMRVPNPETWATFFDPDPDLSPHGWDCEADEGGECEPCRDYWFHPGYPTTELDPKDARVSMIDVEAEKTALEASLDQTIAHSREHGGYFHDPATPPTEL